MIIVTETVDIKRVPDLPERPVFSGPWHVIRTIGYADSQHYIPPETYYTRMDEAGMIYIWHPVNNTLRCI